MILSEWEYISLLPLVITLLLAFMMRSALVAMLVGTFLGTLLIGMTPVSYTHLTLPTNREV